MPADEPKPDVIIHEATAAYRKRMLVEYPPEQAEKDIQDLLRDSSGGVPLQEIVAELKKHLEMEPDDA